MWYLLAGYLGGIVAIGTLLASYSLPLTRSQRLIYSVLWPYVVCIVYLYIARVEQKTKKWKEEQTQKVWDKMSAKLYKTHQCVICTHSVPPGYNMCPGCIKFFSGPTKKERAQGH